MKRRERATVMGQMESAMTYPWPIGDAGYSVPHRPECPDRIPSKGPAMSDSDKLVRDLYEERTRLQSRLHEAEEHHEWHHGGLGGLHVSDEDWRVLEAECDRLREENKAYSDALSYLAEYARAVLAERSDT